MPSRANQSPHFILGFFQVGLIDGLGVEADSSPGAVDLEISLGRDVDETILGLAEHAAFRHRHAHHGEREPLDLESLSDRIGFAEKIVLHIRTQHRDGGVMVVFDVGEIAPVCDLGIAERGPIRRGAGERDIGQALRTQRHVHVAPRRHSDIAN